MISTLVERIATGEDAKLFSLDEAKKYMRVEFGHEDALIESQVLSVVQACEDYTRRSFLQQRRVALFSVFDMEKFDHPLYMAGMQIHRAPVSEIESLQLVAKGQDSATTLTQGTHYWLTDDRLYADYDLLMEALRASEATHLRLTYIAGDTKADFLQKYPALVEALKMTLHNAWDGRGFNSEDIPPQAKMRLAPYRNVQISDV